MSSAFDRLRKNQRFGLKEGNDVVVHFGKYDGRSFKEIAEDDTDYLQWLLDVHEDRMSPQVRERLVNILSKNARFWI